MHESQPALITAAEAAAILGLSVAGVRLHDARLEPLRVGARGFRIYVRDRVEAFRDERARPRPEFPACMRRERGARR